MGAEGNTGEEMTWGGTNCSRESWGRVDSKSGPWVDAAEAWQDIV